MKLKALVTIAILFLFFAACKKETEVPVLETSTVTDIDGNVYKTVKLGDDWWMCENLKVKTYRNGRAIYKVLNSEPDSIWEKLDSAAFADVDQRFGLYYNWHCVNNTNQLAPEGWHVATDEDWKTLERNIGMSEDQSNKTSWRGENISQKLLPLNSVSWPQNKESVFGNDSCQLLLLPGGCKLFNSTTGDVGQSGYWWCSTEESKTLAWYRNISTSKTSVFRYKLDKRYGLPVRCVKNK